MALEQEIAAIRDGIKTGRFPNEASVSQGIVLRLLNALGWPAYDTQVVWPEYSLSGRRVDFALCHPTAKPIAIIEVKQIGQSDGAERQLFEYAFHEGVPMAILTDGREWNFFLPGEQGAYSERRVYKLNIVERDLDECAARLKRYLLHSSVTSGAALHAARDDYRNVSKTRQMGAALPAAWAGLIADEDDMLIEIVADRVESVCGFKPDPDMIIRFLTDLTKQPLVTSQSFSQVRPANLKSIRPSTSLPSEQPPFVRIQAPLQSNPSDQNVQKKGTPIGYELAGQFHPARNAIDVLRQIIEQLSAGDATFSERFAERPHGKSRRYLTRDRDELYRRPDLCLKHSIHLRSGWWLSTNHSRNTIETIARLACEVAGLKYGQDLKMSLAISDF
ncbi:hypothetical protein [Massilia sp. TWP1-3-3]|uniref:hypothetical protein n=1 Tax=Massilia sp. TWP1-3-3 TaxID=2804573 RepID=UPI003CE963A0